MRLLNSTGIPAARYRAYRGEFDAAIAHVLRNGQFILGEQVLAFEREFARHLRAKHCVTVASGTDALELILRASGIGAGHAVLTVSHTAVATVAAIERAGAIPVLVDIDPATFTMDPGSLEQTIDEFTRRRRGPALRAVIPVHLYGHPADMPRINSIAKARGLLVFEDGAQSHDASLRQKRAGTWGDAAAFSFYPTKNLGGFGDGGAVVTNNGRLAEKIRRLREYGWKQRFVSSLPGLNSRLDELQAALLRVGLKHLPAENNHRREIAHRYDEGLASAAVVRPKAAPHAVHVFHQYVVRTERRHSLQTSLAARQIITQVHYPVPIHRQPAYVGRLYFSRAGLPQTEAAAREVLSLPMSPFLKVGEVEDVCSAVCSWRRTGKART